MTVKPCSQESLSPLVLQVSISSCRETPLCSSPGGSRDFSLKHLASWEGVIFLVLRHAPAEPAQGKQAGSLLAAQTQALPEHSTQNAQQQTNLVGHLPRSQHATAWQVAHTPPWCRLCSDLQRCTGLCPSPQRPCQLPVLTESQ